MLQDCPRGLSPHVPRDPTCPQRPYGANSDQDTKPPAQPREGVYWGVGFLLKRVTRTPAPSSCATSPCPPVPAALGPPTVQCPGDTLGVLSLGETHTLCVPTGAPVSGDRNGENNENAMKRGGQGPCHPKDRDTVTPGGLGQGHCHPGGVGTGTSLVCGFAGVDPVAVNVHGLRQVWGSQGSNGARGRVRGSQRGSRGWS